MPVTVARRWTVQEVLALPEEPGKRFEVVDGELLVSPSPRLRHQRGVRVLLRAIDTHVESHRLGEVLSSPADLDLRDGQLVQPDIFVVGYGPEERPEDWSEVGVPILVVEVLSPSTARYDRTLKRKLYQRTGVAEYWIVDLDARLIERWRPEDDRPEILTDQLAWSPAGSADPLALSLPEFFTTVIEG